ncbi:MAG TPA: hypothetical protein VMP11_07395 [Verrucomicrobiae bacterium]|nr:hypothetical protein [Verrucomicrobiae bacterium]
MTTQVQEIAHGMEGPAELHKTAGIVTSGSMAETVAGGAALVLSIIALAGIEGMTLSGVACIVLGAALLMQGWAIGARYTHLIYETEGGLWSTAAELGSGVTIGFLAGATGIVLGLLTLLGMADTVLLPVAAIVFGGALLLTCGATSKLDYLRMSGGETKRPQQLLAHGGVAAAATLQVLLGLGAVVLGILALLHIHWMLLMLIGFLAVSAALIFSGAAVSGRLWGGCHP